MDMYHKNGHHDKVHEMYNEMVRRRIQPREVHCSILISSSRQRGGVASAHNVFWKLVQSGKCKDVSVWNTMIGIYGKVSQADNAMKVFAEMERQGVKADCVTYNALIDMFGKLAMFDEVEDLLSRMEGEGLRVNAYTMGSLVSTYGNHGHSQKAKKLSTSCEQIGERR